jgi:hypothetical protein
MEPADPMLQDHDWFGSVALPDAGPGQALFSRKRGTIGALKKGYPECSCREIEVGEIHKYEIIAARDHRRLLLCISVLIALAAQCRWSLGY